MIEQVAETSRKIIFDCKVFELLHISEPQPLV